jgi:hypothetical protein
VAFVGAGRIWKERGIDDFKALWKNSALCGLIEKKYGRCQSLPELFE